MSRGLMATMICCVVMHADVAPADAIAVAEDVRSTMAVSNHSRMWCAPSVLAQVTKDPLGLGPEDRKRYDEHLHDADHSLFIGYIAAGLGIACIVVGIALMLYRDYQKKRNSPGS